MLHVLRAFIALCLVSPPRMGEGRFQILERVPMTPISFK